MFERHSFIQSLIPHGIELIPACLAGLLNRDGITGISLKRFPACNFLPLFPGIAYYMKDIPLSFFPAYGAWRQVE